MWRYLTDTHNYQGPMRMDSVQNGLLLSSALHAYWDAWCMSINPVSILSVYSKKAEYHAALVLPRLYGTRNVREEVYPIHEHK
jgi:HNH endonuclease